MKIINRASGSCVTIRGANIHAIGVLVIEKKQCGAEK